MKDLGINAGATGSQFIKWNVGQEMFENGDGEVGMDKFLFDYHSLKSGWGKIQPGISPIWVWDEELGLAKSNPGANEDDKKLFKRALSVDLYTKKEGFMTWTTNGAGAREGLNEIWVMIYEAKDNNPGKLPVVKLTGANKKQFKIGGTSVPTFELVGWAAKPDDFAPAEPESELPTEQPAAESTFKDDEIPF